MSTSKPKKLTPKHAHKWEHDNLSGEDQCSCGAIKELTPEKHAGGRPTDYLPEYSTDDYFDKFKNHCEDEKSLLGMCSLAVFCKVTEKTLSNWAENHPEFLRTIGRVKQYSKNMLVNNGLNKKYSDRITRLLLSANHGVHEKTEQDINLGMRDLLTELDGKTKGLPT